ncbi:MAG: hypothetical protein KDN05_08055 [Verrucomicrobiae bacterium]|nr:hypothetical protein [Verrucomicrobiae bacterium]MCB1131066.1 hypothetical protein [Verrucomicrobiae bacterium]
MTESTIPEVIHFLPAGTGAGLYTEAIDLQQIGCLEVTRASQIEFNDDTQQWDVFDFTGNAVFSHPSREACLRWERQHFNEVTQSEQLETLNHPN